MSLLAAPSSFSSQPPLVDSSSGQPPLADSSSGQLPLADTSRGQLPLADTSRGQLSEVDSFSDQSSRVNSQRRYTNLINENEISKPPPVIFKADTDRQFLNMLYQKAKEKRCAARKLLCCGSELSLVSLANGLDLKDTTSKDKKNSIEHNSDSDESDYIQCNPSPGLATTGFIDIYNMDTFKEAHFNAKYRRARNSGSQQLRGHWTPRWRLSQPSASPQSNLSCGGLGSNEINKAKGSSGSGCVHDIGMLYPEDDDSIWLRKTPEEVETELRCYARTILPPTHSTGSQIGATRLDSLPPAPPLNMVTWQVQQSRGKYGMNQCTINSPQIHTQVDFAHCLVPQLVTIMSCPFYWGIMDRYEAERLLDNKPEGTFLLRDSAQDDFLFSVSFRRYSRSLHARVEQCQHRFSFDAHDPAVFSAPSVCELLLHFKDPTYCMFFEPLLTRPLCRKLPFSLQHICRAVICDRLVYDQIQTLPLPNSLKQFLQIYHYKQKVGMRQFDVPRLAYGDTNILDAGN